MNRRHSDPPSAMALWGLFASLGLTFLMVTGSTPLVNAGITRMTGGLSEGAEVATFALAFALSVFLHGPTFTTRDICLKVIEGRTSLRRCAWVVFSIAGLCTLTEVLAATTLLGPWLFENLLGTSEALAQRASKALLYFTPLSFLIAWRGIYQAIHISRGRSRVVGLGTLLRLTVLGSIAVGLSPYLPLDGAVMGGVAFSCAVFVEASFAAWSARELEFSRRDDSDTSWTFSAIARLALPLWFAQYLQVMTVPLVLRIMSHTHNASSQVAAFEIVKSLVWFLSSTVFACQSITIHWAHSRAHLWAVVRFAAVVSALFSALLALLLLPDIQFLGLSTLMKVDQESLRQLVAKALPWAVLFPFLTASRSVLRGLAIRTSHTLSVTFATSLAVVSPVILLFMGVPYQIEGAVLGVVCWVGVQVIEVALLWGAISWGGAWRQLGHESN